MGRSVAGGVAGGGYGTGALNVLWILHDLEAILLGSGEPATADDAPALWAELTAGD